MKKNEVLQHCPNKEGNLLDKKACRYSPLPSKIKQHLENSGILCFEEKEKSSIPSTPCRNNELKLIKV
jgi:hypothetical protein